MEKYIQKNKDKFIDELLSLLKIPSISTDAQYAPELRRTAEFVRDRLKEAGADEAEIYETPGHPIVYGEKPWGRRFPPCWYMVTTMYNPPTPLSFGSLLHFSPLSKMLRFMPEALATTRARCTSTSKPWKLCWPITSWLAT